MSDRTISTTQGVPPRPGATTPVARRLAPLLPAIVASILPVFLIGALVGPMGSELGYREATAGLLMAAFFAVSALVSRKAGALADSVGPITTLQIGLVGSAIVAAGVAAGVRSVTLLAIAMMVGGACNALTQIAANVLQALGPEDQEHDHQNDQKLLPTDTHDDSPDR